MPDLSDAFTGRLENLDQLTVLARENIDKTNVMDTFDVHVAMNDLYFLCRHQILLIKALLIELDDISFDLKQLQSKQK